jgi:hypothetical protein
MPDLTIGAPRTILWRRLDRPGHESTRLAPRGDGWEIAGASVFPDEGAPCRLDFRVTCDAAWRTRSARVTGWIGARLVALEVTVDAEGRWRLDGAECPAVAGCVDIDLNWSPATNLLPIRRLGLAPGEGADVRAAWLRFPSLVLEPLDQAYRRIDSTTYRYESATGFVADLVVDASGLVLRYPGFCEAVATTGG